MNGKWKLETYLGLIMLACVMLLFTKGVAKVSGSVRKCVVVDAGHGGVDPGKVGINGAKEKEINLEIAQKLKSYLEKSGITVVMTREEDIGLYDEGASNKKREDMVRRCEIIDRAAPVFTVSIHQNSYSDASVCGPQVFYYEQSEEGRKIAESIQKSMNERLQIARPRAIKANDVYYLLKKTKSPTVIVECGFLSNSEESEKLKNEEYQKKIAEAIFCGIKNLFFQKIAKNNKIYAFLLLNFVIKYH